MDFQRSINSCICLRLNFVGNVVDLILMLPFVLFGILPGFYVLYRLLVRAHCAPPFLPTMFACWHTSLQMETHNQNDRSVIIQIEYSGLDKILIFSLFLSSLYRLGPTVRLIGKDCLKEGLQLLIRYGVRKNVRIQ